MNNDNQHSFKAPPFTPNTTDLDSDKLAYDWRRRLISPINTTGDDLAKYDCRKQLRGGGSFHYRAEDLPDSLRLCHYFFQNHHKTFSLLSLLTQ